MTDSKLVDLMQLEKIEETLYRGQSWDLGFRALFGGQVMGQSLAAALSTVPEGRLTHSFHSYFLLPGDANQPVVYEVENVRDGRSFCTRRVKAIQHGRNIFYMTASFQIQEAGLQHQAADMPQVPQPEELKSDLQFYQECMDSLSERMREALVYHKPIDIRTVNAVNPYEVRVVEPKRYIWMKAQETIGDDVGIHQAILAYASDYHFLATSLQPHGVSLRDKSLRMATIDHSIWFHQPIQADEWLLHVCESPFSGNARGMVRGQFFNQAGVLVASTMQEGLMRNTQKTTSKESR